MTETRIVDERAETLTAWEAGLDPTFRRDDFGYLTNDDQAAPRFVKVGTDSWFDTGDLLWVGDQTRLDNHGWDAYADDTVFSRWVFKFLDGDDDGFVRIGHQYA